MALLLRTVRESTQDRMAMTLKIERVSDGHSTTIRLIGRMRAEHLDELKALIKDDGLEVTLDMEEVRLVDVEVVRFLETCQAEGIRLVHCSPYINAWINRERSRES